jgi:hypothetical protein
MRWHRGLVIALIQLAMAVPLILHEDARVWQYLSSHDHAATPSPTATPQVGEAVPFAPVCYTPSAEDLLLEAVNLPAALVSGWHRPTPLAFTPAAIAQSIFGRGSRMAELGATAAFVVLLFLQWLIVGAVPTPRWERGLLEPATVIAVCAAVGIGGFALNYGSHPAIGNALFGAAVIVIMAEWLLWFAGEGVTLLRAAKTDHRLHVAPV